MDELLDGVQPQGQMDVVADFAGRLPARVFAEILGLPAEDWECLHRWSDDCQYCSTSDLISALMAVQEQGDCFSEEEVIALCIMLFISAEQTTISLIGNSVLALLRHPEQLALLRQQPELMPSAVEELMHERKTAISPLLVVGN